MLWGHVINIFLKDSFKRKKKFCSVSPSSLWLRIIFMAKQLNFSLEFDKLHTLQKAFGLRKSSTFKKKKKLFKGIVKENKKTFFWSTITQKDRKRQQKTIFVYFFKSYNSQRSCHLESKWRKWSERARKKAKKT